MVNNGGRVAPGDNTSGYFGGAGTLTVATATLNGGAVLDVDLGASSDLLAVTLRLDAQRRHGQRPEPDRVCRRHL